MALRPRVFVISTSRRMDLILALEMLKFVSVGFSTLISSILKGSSAENTDLKKRLKREAWFWLVYAVLQSYSISDGKFESFVRLLRCLKISPVARDPSKQF